jgi:signal transduction histidine kinase/ActR/RegA family two-component response regulator
MAAGCLVTMLLFAEFGDRTLQMVPERLILAITCLTVSYFIFSSTLIAAYIAISSARPFFAVWSEDLGWMWINDIAAGVSAAGVAFLVAEHGYSVFLIPASLIIMVYLFYETYFRKLRTAHQRTEQVEEQLRQAQKLEAVGRLAGGVAHDFNNLMTAILGYSDLMLATLPRYDPLRRHVTEIKNAGERAASLTHQLLAFSGKQMLQPKTLDLGAVLADSEAKLSGIVGDKIKVRVLREHDAGLVKADPGQIQQVVTDLATNARDAMPAGGTLTLEVGNSEINAFQAIDYPGLKPGSYVLLTVTDTGCGMDKEILAHIFEPFFTTKEMGKGTGLGLATVYGIVKQSGGDIEVDSSPGIGTVFRIYLPRIPDTEEGSEGLNSASEMDVARRTILVVENDGSVRGLLCRIIRDSGYQVLEASTPTEALQLSQDNRRTIDVVITDVVTPQMRAGELAERILAQRPECKVLFVSGYSEETLRECNISENTRSFLRKPFTPKTVTTKISEILSQGASGARGQVSGV